MSLRDRLNERLMQTHGLTIDDRGQLGLNTIIAAFSLVVIGVALVYALDVFSGSIGNPQNSQLSQSQASMYDGFAALAGFIEPLLIIAGVVVLLGLIRRVQG
ncbi:MAG: hypothetical protein RI560_04410 [Natronomonas sp.]|uniref:hypothetical protein n=1 Tax=Natronomonas sp. TaxID=2184060 RepID=UPI00286FF14A|nr:hypothetical protein [Natronomonas sp.]MDR9380899.1 hypothetical protein [Natronomonas sp.]MDR9431871.1 hypothetical protein [Natronomonas sp.]